MTLSVSRICERASIIDQIEPYETRAGKKKRQLRLLRLRPYSACHGVSQGLFAKAQKALVRCDARQAIHPAPQAVSKRPSPPRSPLPGEPEPICPTASTSPWIRTPNPLIGTMHWPSFCCISFGRGHGPWTRQAAIKTTTDRGSDLACDGLPSFAALSPCLSDRHTGKYSEPHGC